MYDIRAPQNKLVRLSIQAAYIWHSVALYAFHTKTGPKHLGQLFSCWLACFAIVRWVVHPIPVVGYITLYVLGGSLLLATLSLVWCRWQFKALFHDNPPLCDKFEQIAKQQKHVSHMIKGYIATYHMLKTRASAVQAIRADLLAMTYGFDTPGQEHSFVEEGKPAPNPGELLSAVLVAIVITVSVIILGTAYLGW